MIKMLRKRKYLVIVAVAACFLTLIFFSLRIKEITVTGNSKYTNEEIIDILFPESVDYHTVYNYIKDRVKLHKKIPFIQEYKIVFRSLSQIEIIIYEKSVVGYVSYMGNYLYFDKDGIIVESSDTKLDDIPQITGLAFGHIVLYQSLPVEDQTVFEEILNLTQILSVYNLKVDKIYYDTFKNATLYIGAIQVVLGDSQHMNGKIGELSNILPEIQGLSGTLYLHTYDENNNSIIYSFKRK